MNDKINTILYTCSLLHFRFRMYWGISYKCRCLDLYRVTLFFVNRVAVSEVKMSRQMTLGRFHRNAVMETKVPDFVKNI